MSKNSLIATTGFGLEAVVKREAQNLGFQDINVKDGRVEFSGGFEEIAKANIWLRSAERVQIKLGEFEALTFDELFEKTKALPWGDWISMDGVFPVDGKSINSKLSSVPDCQAIVKKAVVEKLKQKYNIEWFEECGAEYKIQVALLKNIATLTLDTTGAGLHKRGYRENANLAPIKETLANALIDLSYWRKEKTLLDPLCGSGTIAIEAALKAKNIAPGISRSFASEKWDCSPDAVWKNERKLAFQAINQDFRPEIFASDIDEKAIMTAKHNAKLAGVDDCISFEVRDFRDVELPAEYGVVITNPPYAERLGSYDEVSELYKEFGRKFKNNPNWSVYVITPDEFFEKLYGKKADAKRKLYNGRIKTDVYQYFGKKPPRE